MPLDQYEQMTTEEIKAQLEQTQAQEVELRRQFDEARRAEVDALVDEIKQRATALGVDPAEIAKRFLSAKPPKQGRKRKQYRCKRTGNIYKGGRLPAWLNDIIMQVGTDYPSYRDEHMEEVS